jgi:hypothetical protein
MEELVEERRRWKKKDEMEDEKLKEMELFKNVDSSYCPSSPLLCCFKETSAKVRGSTTGTACPWLSRLLILYFIQCHL